MILFESPNIKGYALKILDHDGVITVLLEGYHAYYLAVATGSGAFNVVRITRSASDPYPKTPSKVRGVHDAIHLGASLAHILDLSEGKREGHHQRKHRPASEENLKDTLTMSLVACIPMGYTKFWANRVMEAHREARRSLRTCAPHDDRRALQERCNILDQDAQVVHQMHNAAGALFKAISGLSRLETPQGV